MRILLILAVLATLAGFVSAQSPYVDVPAFSNTYSSTTSRGFQCQAPCAIKVVGVMVPNEIKGTHQHVAVFSMATKAPAWSSSTTLTPSWAMVGQAAYTTLMVSPPVEIPAGHWLGTIGTCSTGTGAVRNSSSYGARGPFTTGLVGGQATTLYRLLTQSSMSTLTTTPMGQMICSSEDVGNTSRVYVYVVALGGDNAKPKPGTTVNLTCEAGLDAGLDYVVALSFGKGPIVIGKHKIELGLDDLFLLTAQNLIPLVLVNARGTLDADGLSKGVAVKFPNLPVLTGIAVRSSFVTIDPKLPSGISSASKPFVMTVQ